MRNKMSMYEKYRWVCMRNIDEYVWEIEMSMYERDRNEHVWEDIDEYVWERYRWVCMREI